MPELSIVIRNRNEGATLQKVIAAIQQQAFRDYEIVVVDNESNDNSLSIARQAGARIVHISRKDFTYGRAINLGVQAASGEIVILLSAHSIPLQRDFLDIVRAGFDESDIAGVRCVQATRREESQDWYRLFELGPGTSTAEIIAWGLNATCCAVRRSVWERVKFDEKIEAVEDKLWTRQVLDLGYRIRRVPAIYSYVRQPGMGDGVHRAYREALGAYRAFGIAPNPSLKGPISACTVGGMKRYLQEAFYTWKRYMLLKRVKRDAQQEPRIGSIR